MVKGAWIVTVGEMRCKNWINGIEVVFHLNENGHPAGNILPPPDKFWDKVPQALDITRFLHRMRRRATIVFYRAYYQCLLRTHYGRTSYPHLSEARQLRLEG